MDRDPDYVDPTELKRRAAVTGGAGAKSGRPMVRRVAEDESPTGAVRLGNGAGGRATNSRVSGPGLSVSGHADVKVS